MPVVFDSKVARNSIYLDFEGLGKSKEGGSPPPHMAGIYRPQPCEGASPIYNAVFFKTDWRPAKNGTYRESTINTIEATIRSLIDEARRNNSLIVHWSDYERSVIEREVPDLLDSFIRYSYNLLPPIRKIKNSRGYELDKTQKKELNKYLIAFNLTNHLVKEINPGAAEHCKRIDKLCEKHKKWKHWLASEKKYVNDLLNYNEQDCMATWQLAEKLVDINMHNKSLNTDATP